jgi:hypothetical protein
VLYQRVDDDRRQWHGALIGFGLGEADSAVGSARWRTWSSPRLRSTSTHLGPRNSEARRPVKMAVRNNGRQRPSRRAMMARTSSGDGISTPILSLPLCGRAAPPVRQPYPPRR